jgi:Calcineurin-like phosphoesterase superfamily domain
MKLGILADIHEQTDELRKAIDILQQHGAERFVVLGDVFEMGKRIEDTVRLLQDVEAVGVWGNHDIGLCFDLDEEVRQRYSAAVLDFMGSLQPRLAIDGCLFTHVEPWLDPHKIEDLWYFARETRQKLCGGAEPYHVLGPLSSMAAWLVGGCEGLAGRNAGKPRSRNSAPCRRSCGLGR